MSQLETIVNRPRPQTALEGFENAERLKGTELKVTDNGTMTCNTFPELRVDVSSEGVSVRGLTHETMAKPENAADAAAVVARVYDVARRNGVKLVFESEEAAKTAAGLMVEVKQQGLARAQKHLDTRANLMWTLFRNGLGTSVTFDEASFKTALASTENGRPFVNSHGDICGFYDAKGGIHFNPQHLKMDTPFHEYGHAAKAVVEKVNPTLLERGMKLIGETNYYREMAEMAKLEGHPYFGMSEMARDAAEGKFAVGNRAMNGAARKVKQLTQEDYKKKKPQETGESSLPGRKDPGTTRGVSNGQAVSVVRQSLEAPDIVANVPHDVKGVYNGLVD